MDWLKTLLNTCLKNNMFVILLCYLFGREWLTNLSVICVENKPCNSSQILVCKGMFVFVNAFWQKCSSFVCFKENSSEHSLVFVLKRMLVMPLSYLLWKECLWIPLFFVKECLEILSANFFKDCLWTQSYIC